MRELPEPEASFHTNDSGWWIEGKSGTDMFTRDQVLAIQKQAYEDGLRDAANRADSFGHEWSGAPAHAFFKLAEELRAMLTASQKEPQ